MKKYGMVIDVAKCTGCNNCYLACKDENAGEEHEGYTAPQPIRFQNWIHVNEIERGTFPKVKLSCVPVTCGHCDNPRCMTQAKDGAVYKRRDGIVIIDPEKAKGQKDIVNTCPYRVICWNEELQLPQKCDLCAHLLDRGYENPRCVEMCPTGALTFGDLNDPDSEISKLVAETNPASRHPEFELQERVLYLNNPKSFISGTVVYKDDDMCVVGAVATLKRDGKVEQTYVTNAFGDFWFDGLDSKTDYEIIIELEGYKTLELKTRTLASVNMGDLFLERA